MSKSDIYDQKILFHDEKEEPIKNTIYSISDIASKFNISEHTVRKYESDYDLKIPRNELDHRYYTEAEVKVFEKILEWKAKGFNKTTINNLLNHSVDALEQKEKAMELVTVDQLTGAEIKDMLVAIITQHEQELEKKFEEKLQVEIEKAQEKIIAQISSENKKLLDYMAITKEEKDPPKKGFWSNLFGGK